MLAAKTPTLIPHFRHPLLARLIEAAAAVQEGENRRARTLLGYLSHVASVCGTPTERLVQLFAGTLMSRLEGHAAGGGNLYLDNSDPRDMLAAFQVLVEATPFVRYGYASANAAILRAVADASRVHVVDVGIGSGTQWLGFMETLASRWSPPSFRLTGIDVPGPGNDPARRLNEVGMNLSRRAAELGLDFSFSPVAAVVEDFDFTTLDVRENEALAVNAAFALHHVPAGDGAVDSTRSRNAVLRRLRALPMRVLSLVEPDSEHNALPFVPRVCEAVKHYLAVFEALDTLLPPELPERATIERAFFGREILNIITGEGSQRVERHERHEAWCGRLKRQGFTPVDMTREASELWQDLRLERPFSILADEGALRLAWHGSPLLAASAWRPAPAWRDC